MTLDEARAQWRAIAEGDGGHCPCCDRWGKVYHRHINRTMAASVIWLSQQAADDDGWVHVPTRAPKWLMRSNQLASMRWWGLIERKPVDPDNRADKHSGCWRMTRLGNRWVANVEKVPRTAWTYGGEVVRLDGDPIGPAGCFNVLFDYEEVMDGRFDSLGT